MALYLFPQRGGLAHAVSLTMSSRPAFLANAETLSLAGILETCCSLQQIALIHQLRQTISPSIIRDTTAKGLLCSTEALVLVSIFFYDFIITTLIGLPAYQNDDYLYPADDACHPFFLRFGNISQLQVDIL